MQSLSSHGDLMLDYGKSASKLRTHIRWHPSWHLHLHTRLLTPAWWHLHLHTRLVFQTGRLLSRRVGIVSSPSRLRFSILCAPVELLSWDDDASLCTFSVPWCHCISAYIHGGASKSAVCAWIIKSLFAYCLCVLFFDHRGPKGMTNGLASIIMFRIMYSMTDSQ